MREQNLRFFPTHLAFKPYKNKPICTLQVHDQRNPESTQKSKKEKKKNSVVRVKVRREACTGGGSGARLQNPLLNAWDSYIRARKG